MRKVIKIILLAIFILLSSQDQTYSAISKQEAINNILNNVIGAGIDTVNVYMEPEVIIKDYYNLSPYDSIINPYDTSWLFFVDYLPLYDWGHSCKYVFINIQNGDLNVFNTTQNPWEYKSFMDEVSIAIDNNFQIIIDTTQTGISENIVSPNDNLYAVLFSGNGEFSFWSDLSHIFCGLTNNYGFPEGNIFAFSGNGQSNGWGQNNWSNDLDQDGIDDIDGICNFDNISSTFEYLEATLQDDDILYIHIACHGHKINNSYYVNLYQDQPLYDEELAGLLENINCSQIIIGIESCYSGGFISTLSGTHRNIKTSTDELTPGLNTGVIHPFSNYWGTVIRGFHILDETNPWIANYPIGSNPNISDFNPDDITYGGNNDGYIQLGEANTYVNSLCLQTNWIAPSFQYGFADDLLCFNGLVGKISTSQLVAGNYLVAGTLTLATSVQLSLYNNTHLFFNDNSKMTIEPNAILITSENCGFNSIGSDNSIIIKGLFQLGNSNVFSGNVIDENCLKIVLENNSANTFNQASFSLVDISGWGDNINILNSNLSNSKVILSKGDIDVNNCAFSNSCLWMAKKSTHVRRVDVNNSVFHSYDECPIYIKSYDDYLIDSCTIENNGGDGIQIHYSGYGIAARNIRDCIIQNNGILETTTAAGIRIYSSNAEISTTNYIAGNPYGIQCLDQSNVIIRGNSFAQYVNETQNITYNDINQVYATHYSFPPYFHYNAVFYNNNPYPLVYHDIISGTSPDEDVRANYWSTDFDPLDDLYGGKYTWDPIWQLSSGGEIETYADERMYNNASAQITDTNFFEASDSLKLLVETFPDSIYAHSALKLLFAMESESGGDYSDLLMYYKTNTTIQSNDNLKKTANFLIAMCEIEREYFSYAINYFDSIILNPETYEDSIFAIIDLAYTYDKMGDTLLKSSYCGLFPQYKFTSAADYNKNREFHIDLLFKNHLENNCQNNDLLFNEIEYGSVKVYPNPSSKYVNIEVVLESGQFCELRIYNILGKMYYRTDEIPLTGNISDIRVNISEFPTGVYCYQLKFDNDSKKSGKIIKQ